MACAVAQDGSVSARFPDGRVEEIPPDAVNRSKLLYDAVDSTDSGQVFELPESAWVGYHDCLHRLSSEKRELTATDDLVQFMKVRISRYLCGMLCRSLTSGRPLQHDDL